jgi:hypothetical protein
VVRAASTTRARAPTRARRAVKVARPCREASLALTCEPLIRLRPIFWRLALAALACVLFVTNNESPQPAAVRP